MDVSKNRVLTFVVVLRNKTGGPFQIDTNLVGSLYFMFSKLTLCMVRVSLDQKRLQLSCDPFWYKSKKEGKYQKSIQSKTTPDPGPHGKVTKHKKTSHTKMAKRPALSQEDSKVVNCDWVDHKLSMQSVAKLC